MAAVDGNELGAFLRASRARVEPTDAGLPGSPGRRVPGLRREEVAALAGVSADYYTRLEQGRERNPSAQVLTAIGRALRFTSDQRAHLFRLAGLHPELPSDEGRARVHPKLLELLDSFPTAAAYVLGPAFDILAANPIAGALLSPFDPERNMTRILFTHPAARSVFVDWEQLQRSTVATLRLNHGLLPDHPDIDAVVSELSAVSAGFREQWGEQNVAGLGRAFKVFQHPDVGRVELNYQTFGVQDTPGQQLLIGSAEPGSRSAEALTFLAATAAR